MSTSQTADDTAEQRAHATGLKVHLRQVLVGRSEYRVVTLRDATKARFSTNFFHGTWHILTDREGAFVLARLLWGLAFQRAEGTLVMIDAGHLVPTPFEADPPSPVLLVPTHLTRVDGDSIRELRKHLRTQSNRWTARWHTFGLPGAVDAQPRQRFWRSSFARGQRDREQMSKLGSVISYAAPPDVLRAQALEVYRMRGCRSMDYHYLAENSRATGWHAEGEVQILRDFRDRVSASRVARRCIIGTNAWLSEVEREEVYGLETIERARVLGRRARKHSPSNVEPSGPRRP